MHFKYPFISLVTILLFFTSCYKDKVETTGLNTNPWDLDYIGEDYIKVDTSYFDSTIYPVYINGPERTFDTITRVDSSYVIDNGDTTLVVNDTTFIKVDTIIVIVDTIYKTQHYNRLGINVDNTMFTDNLSDGYEVRITPTLDNSVQSAVFLKSNSTHYYEYNYAGLSEYSHEICYTISLSKRGVSSPSIWFCDIFK